MKTELQRLTDEELMLAYQGGDEGAFLVLYERYASRIYGYFQGRLRNRTLTDDLFQQCLLKWHKSRHTYKRGLPLGPWIFAICRSALGDLSRQSVPEIAVDDIETAVPPDQVQTRKDQDLAVDLGALNPNEKAAIEGRFQQELSFFDLGKRLGTTETNARKIVSRAVQKLRKGFGL